MLGDRIAQLDIPTDGSAKLVSVHTTTVDGCTQWTVVFRETKGQGTPITPASVSTLKSEPPAPSPAALPSPGKVLTFAPTASDKITSPEKLRMPPALAPVTAPLMPKGIVAAGDHNKMMMDRIFPLKCQVKTYAWGKFGDASLVGLLAAEGLEELELTPGIPYAELWMGSHPSGPSMVMLSSPWRTVTPLSEWIKLNPSLLGPARMLKDHPPGIDRRKSMLRLTASSLPFLFKILSVRTALSIQAHPDKALAAQLHARQPDMYKDDNHKPEMAVAITPFEALCSFQPAYSILENCRATPELVALIGEGTVGALENAVNARAAHENAATKLDRSGSVSPKSPPKGDGVFTDPHESFRSALRNLFRRLVSAPAVRVKEQLEALMKRVGATNQMLRAPVDVLAMRLHEQYPGDVGVFCAYLLNYCTLQPGQALFLAANEPHAYISGDCAEVMATSDNVIRAGLTPKWKDVDTLCDSLTYTDGNPHWVEPTQTANEPHVHIYTPPDGYDEFMLERVELPAEGVGATLGAHAGLSIVIIVKGTISVEQLDEGSDDAVGLKHTLAMGAVHLVCPHTILRMRAERGPVLLFRAAAKPIDDGRLPDLNTGLTIA